MTTPKEARQEIAAAISAVMPDGVTVYPSPPEGITAPAVVISPRQPYRRPVSYCDYELQMRVNVGVQRNASTAGMDMLDDLIDLIIPALNSIPYVAWQAVSDIGVTQDIGSVDYLFGSIDITCTI